MPAPLSPDPFADDRGCDKRKLRQLCKQVERVLSLALGDHPDQLLLDLMVEQVLPWPNASRLLVMVRPSISGTEIERGEILERLEAAKGELRAIVAETINRKRTPELCFEIFAGE